ncbi:TPA: DNA mismatch repair endonuclease MutL [Klebsiella pneumoniae]|nr:DNA mismatch repair endonuclease MutL [Klebsiella pneumoniae]
MPIQVLPPQLANQIAAGEVVERPASVVKELVENSLDAGATRIDIDIERGGAKLIRIRDNGSGIKKDELALALARHATSKIASLDDLEAIISLGFRGEALASISSVARLTLTSRTAEQQEAWQAYAEGRDQAVTVKPAAHPVGTTLEVLDLFYNTPALAEIQYCYVNGRMMRDRLINHAIRQACEDKLGADQQPAFVLYLEIDPHQVDVNVHPAKHEVRFHQSRLVHDFIYQGVLSVLQQQLDAPLAEKDDPPAPRPMPENRIAAGGNQFARPAEAREPAARFSITPSREPAASSARPGGASWPHAQPGYQKQQGALYRQLLDTPTAPKPALQPPAAAELAGHSQSFGRVLTIVGGDCALLEREGGLALLSLTVAERWLRQAQLTPGAEAVCAQPLLIPLRLKVTEGEKQALAAAQPALAQLGIDVHTDALHVTVRAVPLPLRQQNLQILIPELIGYLAQQNAFDVGNIAQWMARNLTSEQTSWNMAQAIALLADVERLCPQLVRTPPGGLLQPVDLHSAMNALKDE